MAALVPSRRSSRKKKVFTLVALSKLGIASFDIQLEAKKVYVNGPEGLDQVVLEKLTKWV